MGQLTARQTARRAALEARVRDHHPLGAGLTVDTTHVVPSGAESRQSLYVALTRGRSENHIYLADAAIEPDSLAGVDSLNPTTAEDILAGVLRRDGAQTSATSTRRILDAPATQLRDAVLRYQDALGRAAARRPRPSRRAAPHRAQHQPAYPPCAVVSRCGRSTARTRRAYFAGPPNCMNSSRPTIPPPCSTGASATARPSLARSRHTRTAARPPRLGRLAHRSRASGA